MPHADVRRAILAGLCASLLLRLLAGCVPASASPLTDRIRSSDASFTAVFPSSLTDGLTGGLTGNLTGGLTGGRNGGEAVVCAGEKTGGTVVLTVVSPSRSAGVRIEADPAARTCLLYTAGCAAPIPVEAEAAEAILAPFSLLFEPAPASGSRAPARPAALSVFSRSDDGTETRIESEDGTRALVLSPDGVPLRLAAPDRSGAPREITIESWSFRG